MDLPRLTAQVALQADYPTYYTAYVSIVVFYQFAAVYFEVCMKETRNYSNHH